MLIDDADAPARVAERQQLLAHDRDFLGRAVGFGQLLRQQNRQPEPAQQLAHGRARAALREQSVVLRAEHGGSSLAEHHAPSLSPIRTPLTAPRPPLSLVTTPLAERGGSPHSPWASRAPGEAAALLGGEDGQAPRIDHRRLGRRAVCGAPSGFDRLGCRRVRARQRRSREPRRRHRHASGAARDHASARPVDRQLHRGCDALLLLSRSHGPTDSGAADTAHDERVGAAVSRAQGQPALRPLSPRQGLRRGALLW